LCETTYGESERMTKVRTSGKRAWRNSHRRRKLSVLFTCIGRRVSLLRSFRKAANELKLEASFLGTDVTELSPALRLCERRFLVKPISHPDYIKEMLGIVKKQEVDLVIPTIDTDLGVLAENKRKFSDLGCRVLVSEPKVIDICQDKRKTYHFLVRHGFDTPETISIRTALSKKRLTWPCFLKPRDGYASRGNAVANNHKELLFFSKKVPNAICQEFINGIEHTCDIYVDFSMKVRRVVPRQRVEVRAGEVSKSKIVKDPSIQGESARLVEELGAGPGVITLQLFVTQSGGIKFIEINPRFGGGVPLSIKAGANFPKWILQELVGREADIKYGVYKDGLVMLRYDDEVWLESSEIKRR